MATKRVNGEGSWGYKTIKGKKYKRFTKTYPDCRKDFYGKTKKEIDEKVRIFEEKRKNKEIIFQQASTDNFGQYALNYIKNEASKTISKRTYSDYIGIVNDRIIPKDFILGELQLGQITPKYLSEYLDYLVNKKKYARETIVKTIRVVKHVLEFGMKENKILLTYDNLKEFKAPPESVVLTPKKEIPFLDKEDMDKLYNEARKPKYKTNGYAIILIMYTGLRIGELQELRWKDVDLKNNTITVNRVLVRIKNDSDEYGLRYNYIVKENPKTPSGRRTIPLNKRAMEAIEYYNNLNPKHTKEDLVCIISEDNPTHKNADNLRRSLQCMLKNGECSVEHCGLHALRHSFGSRLIEEGVDIKVVSILLGHKNVTTTYNYYIHIIKNRLVKSVQIFDE